MSKPLSEAPVAQLTVQDILSGEFTQRVANQAEQLGPIFRWQVMAGPATGNEVVYLVGAEANRLIFNTQRDAFSHDLGWTPLIGDLMGTGLLNQDGADWSRSRKLWNPAFTSAYMETYLPLIQQIIAAHTADWAERGEIDLLQEAQAITFHVTATALAGIDNADAVAQMQRLFYKLLPRAGGFTSDEAYDAFEREALAAKIELDTTLLAIIAARRATPEAQTHDVLGHIVHAHDDQGQQLTDEEVLGHLYVLLVAGHETTTILATWTLYLLATQAAQRERVEAELQNLLAGYAGPLSVEAARNLHVLDLFIREVGRLHSPVQNVPRGVVTPVEFAGYTLPEGTRIRLALGACHRLPQYFAEPNTFDPDRFAAPREEDRKHPYSLVTFGGGSRLCIGVNFANIEVKAIVENVLRNFTLEPVSSDVPLELGFITLSIPGGVPMRVTRRAVPLHG